MSRGWERGVSFAGMWGGSSKTGSQTCGPSLLMSPCHCRSTMECSFLCGMHTRGTGESFHLRRDAGGNEKCCWGTGAQAEVATVKAAMQRRVEEAVAEAEAKAAGLRDAREKNVHFSARVVALNSRVAQLQKQLREAAAREKELAAELELKRGGGMELPLENGGAKPSMAFCPGCESLWVSDVDPREQGSQCGGLGF